MLFLLRNINNGNVFYVANKIEFIVGRKDCDFLIQNDQSISRKHAIIRIKDGQVTIEDCGSKYKTLWKGESLKPNVEVPLEVNDEIQFGVVNSKYRLEQYNFVTTGTRINSSQKTKLKNTLLILGGQYVENWSSDCTHLTVEEVTLTIKVLHALLDEKPIVKPAYWTKFAESVERNMPPPDIDNYNKPPVAEILLHKIELKSNPNRKILFKGKLFVFPKEKNKKQMEELIRKAGGSSISWEKDPMPLKDIKNSPKEFLIIETADMPDDPDLSKVISHFSMQGKRSIPIQEIAMSIVLCSCEKDCNPSFNRVGQVFPTTQPFEPTQNNALVPNTESECFSLRDYEMEESKLQMIIPATESELDASVPFKNENVPSTSGNKSTNKDIINEQKCNKQDLKRTNIDELNENPFKRAKVDIKISHSSSNETPGVIEEKKEVFLSKHGPTRTREVKADSIVNVNEINTDVKPNPFAFLNKNKKRQTEESSNSNEENPFKLLRKQHFNVSQVSDTNPFMMSLGKKKRKNEDTRESSSNKKKKEENIFSSTRIVNNPNKSANFSRISKINNSDINNSWLSKNIKMDMNESAINCFDTEIQKFIDLFKDTVVVEVMAKITIKPKIFEDDIDGGKTSNGRQNFKKFRKVMPLRPQTTVIGKEHFVALGPGNVTGITDSRRETNFSDDETNDNLRTTKQKSKRFII